ncbi:MAG: DUF3048 domain-containing protein [Demequinaceae bacterium]|nr:DUF3048 domain-containing protein [Demequinaceae bacterium]
MIRSRRLRSRILAATAVVVVGGCAPAVVDGPAETLSAIPIEDRAIVPSPPEDPRPAVIWPLTGLSAEGVPQADLDRPAVPIKIENTARGRPQKGIEHADIVFDEMINGRCLRLVAVFHSDLPESVGPIRSARTQDPNIMGSFSTVLFASGCNYQVQYTFNRLNQMLFADDFSLTTGYLRGSDGFERVTRDIVNKDFEFRLWGHPEVFADEAADVGFGPAPQQFEYTYPGSDATAAIEGSAVGTIDIRYSSCGHPHWVWDEDGGVWNRYEFENPLVTMDGNPVTATNVILLRVKVSYTQGYNPEAFVVVSNASGFVATGGKVIPIRWTKSSRGDLYHLTTLDGDPVYLAPGQTWVELVPSSGAVIATVKFDGVVQK